MPTFIKRFFVFGFILASLGASVAAMPAHAQQEFSIVVLRSKDIPPYNSALNGFKDEVSSYLAASFEEFDLEDYDGREEDLLARVEKISPNLIFVIGTEAAVFAKRYVNNIPTIFSMVLNPVESGIVRSFNAGDENVTGIALKISIEKQFEKIKEVIPYAKKIGMLYDYKNMTGLRDEAQAAADKLGLELIARPVYSKMDIDKALNEVVREADVLWAGVDTLIYNPQSAQHILLTTLRNKIPFMAFSSNYVNAGALMALECDYSDIGRQSAEVAIKILSGKKPNEIPVSFPRSTRLIVNEKTADLIGLKLPKVLYK